MCATSDTSILSTLFRRRARKLKSVPSVSSRPSSSFSSCTNSSAPSVDKPNPNAAPVEDSSRDAQRLSRPLSLGSWRKTSTSHLSCSPVGVSLRRYDLTVLKTILRRPAFSPLLPPQSTCLVGRPTLVLDLDETLIHSTPYLLSACYPHTRVGGNKAGVVPTDFTFRIGRTLYHVAKRPGLDEFLEKASKWYELVVFSASSRAYVDAVLDGIDPTRQYVPNERALCRMHCTEYAGGFLIKDLGLLGRDLRKTIIVDNSVVSFAMQPENAILVSSWVSRSRDRELASVLQMADQARKLKDVRQYL